MESPVVVDKPPEYHGTEDRGFPFEEEEGGGAWSELAARHPDIAARLRQHPAAWARKRRPSSHDEHDFGDSFGDFDRFIPSEFREHFPSSFNRRFGPREEPAPAPAHTSQSPPQQQTTATQTEQHPPEHSLPQYGLRNTVDLGQKSAADPSLVDADERSQRSVSAPPESRPHATMSAPGHQEPAADHSSQPRKVRNIPIFVEGRDAPVINDSLDHGSHFGEAKPAYAPPQAPSPDSAYFPEEAPLHFNHPPPNFTRSFGTPFTKQYRQGQPFAQQKVYPQSATAFARGASPHRSQSPHPQHEEYVSVPVHHERPQPKPEPPRPPQRQQPPPPPPQQPQPPPPPEQPTPPPPQPPKQQDPISQILEIQTNVLNLMSEVENFTGTKKDKKYLFLDEMLTRNLISLDNIETEGKENIRNARKEAIRCIQKCIAVLEAKAEGRSLSTPQPQEPAQAPPDVDMRPEEPPGAAAPVPENGEVDMKEAPREELKVEAEQAAKSEEAAPQPASGTEPAQTDTPSEQGPADSVQAPVAEDKANTATNTPDKSKESSTKDKEGAPHDKMAADDKEHKMDVDAGASQ